MTRTSLLVRIRDPQDERAWAEFMEIYTPLMYQLDPLSARLIAKISLQGFSCDEAARLEGCSRWTVLRKYRDAIDKLSEILLKVGILNRIERLPDDDDDACQEAESDEKLLTM